MPVQLSEPIVDGIGGRGVTDWSARRSELFEPLFIDGDVFNHRGLDAEAKFLQLVGKLVAINEVNWRRTVSRGFLDGVA